MELDGSNGQGQHVTMFPLFATGGDFDGVTVMNSAIHHGVASCMLIDGTNWQILNNHIYDCGANPTYDHGIYNGANNSRIAGNLIERSSCYNIQNYGGAGVAPDNNVYENNTFADSGCGVTLSMGANHTFRNNTMVNDVQLLVGVPNTTVEGNQMTGTNLTTINDNAQGSTMQNNTVCNASVEVADGATDQGTSTSCDGMPTTVSAPSPSTETAAASPAATNPLLEAAAMQAGATDGPPPPPPRDLQVLPPRR